MTHKVTKRHISFTICSSQIGHYVKITTYWKIKLVASSLCHVRVNIRLFLFSKYPKIEDII